VSGASSEDLKDLKVGKGKDQESAPASPKGSAARKVVRPPRQPRREPAPPPRPAKLGIGKDLDDTNGGETAETSAQKWEHMEKSEPVSPVSFDSNEGEERPSSAAERPTSSPLSEEHTEAVVAARRRSIKGQWRRAKRLVLIQTHEEKDSTQEQPDATQEKKDVSQLWGLLKKSAVKKQASENQQPIENQQPDENQEQPEDDLLQLTLSEEEVRAQAEQEAQLASRRLVAFGGSAVEFQIAVQHSQDLRRKLLARHRNLQNAMRLFCRNHRADELEGEVDMSEFQHVATSRLKFAFHDTERILRVFQMVDGRNPATMKDFMAIMRYVRPINTLIELRTRLVHRFSSVPLALAAIRGTQSDFSVDQLEMRLLCFAGVPEKGTRSIFKVLDPHHVGLLCWEDLEHGVEHATTYSLLEGLHTQLIRGSKSLEVGLVRWQLIDPHNEDALNTPVDRQMLWQLGVSGDNAEAVLQTLQRHCRRGDDLNLALLVKILHAFDHRQHPAEDLTSVSDAQWSYAIMAWRVLLPKLLMYFPGGIEQAFEYLDIHGGGGVTFAEWVNRLRSTGLADRDEAVALFGIVIDFKHSHWIPGVRGSPKVGLEDFGRAMRLAQPAGSLRRLRARLVEELGSLPKAFEHIAGSEDMSYEVWLKAMRGLWVLQAEAAQIFALFEPSMDGRVSQHAFMKVMRHTEAIMKLQSFCTHVVQEHGTVSRSFEGLKLTQALDQRNFEAAADDLFGAPASDAHAVFSYISPGPSLGVQLADLLDALSLLEEQHYRYLVPLFVNEQAQDDDDENGTGLERGAPMAGSGAKNANRDPQRKYTELPKLDLSNLSNWQKQPVQKQPVDHKRNHSARARLSVTGGEAQDRGRGSLVQLPHLSQSARAHKDSGAHEAKEAKEISSARGMRLPAANLKALSAGAAEADRRQRAQEWVKHGPIQVSGGAGQKAPALSGGRGKIRLESLDKKALEAVRKDLINKGQSGDEAQNSQPDPKQDSWFQQKPFEPQAKDLLT